MIEEKGRESLTEREEELAKRLLRQLFSERQAPWQKRILHLRVVGPLLVGLGVVATFYGFEKILDSTSLVNHPWLMLAFGSLILILTGAFYNIVK